MNSSIKNFFSSGSKDSKTSRRLSSSLRKWLNADFYSMAFSESEKNRIENNSLRNPASGSFINKGTKDKVFVLSSLDVTKYEIELDVLNSRLTDYAKKKISDAKAR